MFSPPLHTILYDIITTTTTYNAPQYILPHFSIIHYVYTLPLHHTTSTLRIICTTLYCMHVSGSAISWTSRSHEVGMQFQADGCHSSSHSNVALSNEMAWINTLASTTEWTFLWGGSENFLCWSDMQEHCDGCLRKPAGQLFEMEHTAYLVLEWTSQGADKKQPASPVWTNQPDPIPV